ncbi:MAG: hypothetical protein ACYTF6_05385 [Planctomycetota bacterium]
MWVVISGTALIVAALSFYLVLVWLRRKYGSSGDFSSAAGFSIGELEAMRESGQISEKEFRRLRSWALGLGAKPGKDEQSELSNSPDSDDEEAEVRGEDPSEA